MKLTTRPHRDAKRCGLGKAPDKEAVARVGPARVGETCLMARSCRRRAAVGYRSSRATPTGWLNPARGNAPGTRFCEEEFAACRAA